MVSCYIVRNYLAYDFSYISIEGEMPSRYTPAIYNMPIGGGQKGNSYAQSELSMSREVGTPGPWFQTSITEEEVTRRNDEFPRSAWKEVVPLYDMKLSTGPQNDTTGVSKEDLQMNANESCSLEEMVDTKADVADNGEDVQPAKSLRPVGDVRYFKKYEYDRLDFITFPSRKGWNMKELNSGHDRSYSSFFRQKDNAGCSAHTVLTLLWLTC